MMTRRTDPRSIAALLIATFIAVLVATGCDGCASQSNEQARQQKLVAVKGRLAQYAAQHPERTTEVDEAIQTYSASDGTARDERAFKTKTEPMLRQYAAENPGAPAESINDMLESWERRLKKFGG